MRSLRVGLVGAGMIGRHHARVLRELDDVELVAIADPGGDPHGVGGDLKVLADIADLIAVGVDYAVVAVPTRFHEGVGLQLAEAGIHALIEKPIAHSAAAGQRLTDAFSKAGLIGAVGHVERYNPALIEMRRRLQLGELGEVFQITTRRQGPFPSRIADVGVATDLASHDVDLAAWIAGAPYTRVFAEVTHRSGRPHEDLIVISGRFGNGIVANHIVSWLSPMKERTTVVTGERGAFVADTLTGDLTFHANGQVETEWASVAAFRGVTEGDVTRFAFQKREPLRSEHEAFRDAVRGTNQSFVSLAEGLQALRVVEAALESSRTRAVVHLQPY